MSLFLYFLSNPLKELTKMHALKEYTKMYFTKIEFFSKISFGFDITPTFVGKNHKPDPKDVLVHICSTFDEISLNTDTAGEDRDTGGKTQLISTQLGNKKSFEGFSEIWLSELTKLREVPLEKINTLEPYKGDKETRLTISNAATLIGATALHEAMHMKVAAGKGNVNFDLHGKEGGGGVASARGGITRVDKNLVAPVTDKNIKLIKEHFDTPVSQIIRSK